jgi:hypothetical protein
MKLPSFRAGECFLFPSTDVVYAPQWDYQRLTVEESKRPGFSRIFFQHPIGVPCPFGLFDRQDRMTEETSMVCSGVLSPGNNFYAIGIRAMIVPGWDSPGPWCESDDKDYDAIARAGVLDFVVSNRIYAQVSPIGRAPACFLTPRRLMKPNMSLLSDLTLKNEIEVYRQTYFEITPVYMDGGMPFSIRISYERPISLESDAMIGVILDGYLIKNIV